MRCAKASSVSAPFYFATTAMKSRTVFCSRIENGRLLAREPEPARRTAIKIERALHLRRPRRPEWQESRQLRQRHMRAVADRGLLPPSRQRCVAPRGSRSTPELLRPDRQGMARIAARPSVSLSANTLPRAGSHAPVHHADDSAQAAALSASAARPSIADQQSNRFIFRIEIAAVHTRDAFSRCIVSARLACSSRHHRSPAVSPISRRTPRSAGSPARRSRFPLPRPSSALRPPRVSLWLTTHNGPLARARAQRKSSSAVARLWTRSMLGEQLLEARIVPQRVPHRIEPQDGTPSPWGTVSSRSTIRRRDRFRRPAHKFARPWSPLPGHRTRRSFPEAAASRDRPRRSHPGLSPR